jgi:hypothetical protein
MTFDEFLARLDNVKGSGDKRTARCPAHADHDNSLSIAKGDKGVVVKCFAGCDVDAICAALRIEVKQLFRDGVSDSLSGGRSSGASPSRKSRSPKPPPKPLTLAELAAAKGLPVDWLREQGVDDFPDGSGVAIGYFLEDGSQAARLRKRGSLGKDGWSWVGPAGVPVVAYGLWRLREWR